MITATDEIVEPGYTDHTGKPRKMRVHVDADGGRWVDVHDGDYRDLDSPRRVSRSVRAHGTVWEAWEVGKFVDVAMGHFDRFEDAARYLTAVARKAS